MGLPDPLDILPEQLKKLSLDDVNAAIRRHGDPENFRAVVVLRDPEAFSRELKLDSSPIQYAAGSSASESGALRDKELSSTPMPFSAESSRAAADIFR